MSTLNLRFEFRSFQRQGNALGSFTVFFDLGEVCLLRADGLVLDGKNGPWLAPATEKSEGRDGKPTYFKRWFPFPDDDQKRNSFQEQGIRAWEDYLASGGGETQRNPRGASQRPAQRSGQRSAPQSAQRAPAPPRSAPATQETVPAGYQKLLDQETGKYYYVAPDGTSSWEPPMKAAPPAPPKSASAAPVNTASSDPLEGFGGLGR